MKKNIIQIISLCAIITATSAHSSDKVLILKSDSRNVIPLKSSQFKEMIKALATEEYKEDLLIDLLTEQILNRILTFYTTYSRQDQEYVRHAIKNEIIRTHPKYIHLKQKPTIKQTNPPAGTVKSHDVPQTKITPTLPKHSHVSHKALPHISKIDTVLTNYKNHIEKFCLQQLDFWVTQNPTISNAELKEKLINETTRINLNMTEDIDHKYASIDFETKQVMSNKIIDNIIAKRQTNPVIIKATTMHPEKISIFEPTFNAQLFKEKLTHILLITLHENPSITDNDLRNELWNASETMYLFATKNYLHDNANISEKIFGIILDLVPFTQNPSIPRTEKSPTPIMHSSGKYTPKAKTLSPQAKRQRSAKQVTFTGLKD